MIKSVYTPMYDPSCHFSFDFFSFFFSFFVLWFRLSGTFDSWFDSLSTERLATILLSSVPLFVFHSFPPHRSPLCMQYNIPHVCFCFFVFFVSKISYGSTMSLMSWNRMKKKNEENRNQFPIITMPSLLFLFCIFEEILICDLVEYRTKQKSINKKRKQTIHLLKECIGMWPLLDIDSCCFFSFSILPVPCDDVTRTHEHTRTNGTHKVYVYIR